MVARIGRARARRRRRAEGARGRRARRAAADRGGSAVQRNPLSCARDANDPASRADRSLSESVSVTAVAKAIVEQARIVVGAAEGESEAARRSPEPGEPGLCMTDAHRDRPARSSSALSPTRMGSYWLSAALAADNGFASMAALPLMVEGRPARRSRVSLQRAGEFRRGVPGAAGLGRAALHAGARSRPVCTNRRERARSEAERANRLKDEFVSTVSHELRTPLNAILGWASMLRTDSMESEVFPQAVESIYRNASRQAKLVDDLLDFARMAGGRTALDLDTIDAAEPDSRHRRVGQSARGGQPDRDPLSPIPDATLRGDVQAARAGVREPASATR